MFNVLYYGNSLAGDRQVLKHIENRKAEILIHLSPSETFGNYDASQLIGN